MTINWHVYLLMLAVTGAADTVSTVIRQTVRQLITSDRLRGRTTFVNMIFFMGRPQLGELEAGLVAAMRASRRATASPDMTELATAACDGLPSGSNKTDARRRNISGGLVRNKRR